MDIKNANSHPFKVAIVGNDNEMYANSHPFKVSIVEGGSTFVTELPETGTPGTMYVLVDDAEKPTKAYGIYTYNNGWVLVAQPVDQAVKKVDELPEVGEEGVLYYVPKTGTDTYDLYRWIDNSWVKVDTDIQLYNNTGEHTDGAMTQKAVTDALNDKQNVLTAGDSIDIANDVISATNTGKAKVLTTADYNANSNDWTDTDPANFNCIALWKLDNGFYSNDSTQTKVYAASGKDVSQEILFCVANRLGGGSSPITNVIVFGQWDASVSKYGKITLYGIGDNKGTAYYTTNVVLWNQVKSDLKTTSSGYVLDARQGKVLKTLIDSIAIRGAGAPTTSTAGSIGTLYEDTTNGELYICTAVYDSIYGLRYTWKKVGFQYTAGEGLNLSASNEFSVDTTVVALKEDLPTTLTDAQYEDLWGEVEEQLTTVVSGTGA